MPSEKKQTNVRLSNEGRDLLEAMAGMWGITLTDAMEIAIRRAARAEGVWKPPHERARERELQEQQQ